MNNKSDKKHKLKQNQKQKQKQSKTKKKTTSRQSKKKNEIKSGGAPWSLKGLFSRKTDESSKMKELGQPLLQNPQQSASSNPQQLVSSNPQQSASTNPQSSVSSQNHQPLTNPVSSTGSSNLTKNPPNKNNWKNKTKLSELQRPLLLNSNRLANAQLVNSNNSQRTASQTQSSANPNNSQRNASQTQSSANSRNPKLNVSQPLVPANPNNSLQTISQPPLPPPNAQPQGLKTIESQSRCSIL